MNIVENVLRYAKVESGFNLNYETTSFDDVLTEASCALKIISSSKNCNLEIDCEDNYTIEIDKMRMGHVLQNLVACVTHFAEDGSNIKLEITKGKLNRKDALKLRIYDKDFKFVENENAQQNAQEELMKSIGLGVGMAVVRKFVDLHDGELNIQLDRESGSVVEILIPGITHIGNSNQSNKGKVKILLVEDDNDIRDYFAEEFEMAGFEVIKAANGEEAANCFFRYKPDIIFSDIRMPVRDGFELLAEVRADNPDMPFIFCSGYYPNLHQDLEKSNYKADLFINKPVSGSDLIEYVEPFMDRVKMAA